MPRGKYVGKRINATVTADMYKQIAEIAKRENRSLSQQVVYFVGLALNEYNKEKTQDATLGLALNEYNEEKPPQAANLEGK